MHSARAAGLAATLAMSLPVGIVGTANAEPSTPPTTTDSPSRPASTVNAPEAPAAPATTPAVVEGSSAPETAPATTEPDTPSLPATPKVSTESIPSAKNSAATNPTKIEETAWIYVATDLRTGAGTQFRSMGRISATTRVVIHGEERNGWAPIRHGDTNAWIPTSALTTDQPRALWTYISTDLRTGASSSFRSMGRTRAAKKIVIRGPERNGWAPVLYEGSQAWVPTNTMTTTYPQTMWVYLSSDLRTGASSSFRSMGRTASTHALIRRGPNYNGWAPVLYRNTQGWVPASTVTTWHPQTQWIYVETELRTGASTSFRSMGRTHATTAMVRRGPNHHGWAPVFYKGKQGWLPGNTVTSTRPQTFWVKRDQTMRTGASNSFRSMGTAYQGTRVVRRGPNHNGWMPVVFNSMQSWIPVSAVSSKPVSAPVSLPINNSGARLDRRCMTGTVICASKNQRKLWMVQNGRILITLDARYGRPSMPTQEGVNTIYWKDKNHFSTSYGSPMPYSMFFYKGQAIHYSSGFARDGWNGSSHGCINIRNMSGLKWLWDHTPTGRKIIVFK